MTTAALLEHELKSGEAFGIPVDSLSELTGEAVPGMPHLSVSTPGLYWRGHRRMKMMNKCNRNDNFEYGCKPEKDEILKRVTFARAVCVDVVKPLDITEITNQIVAAKLPIDDGVDDSIHFGMIRPDKLDTHCWGRR